MVKRRAFYVADGRVRHLDVDLKWDLGFTREAKTEYVRRLKATYGLYFPDKRIEDVTTAGDYPAKFLSPIYIKFDNGESYEDTWNSLKQEYSDKVVYDNFIWKKPLDGRAFVHFYCTYGVVMLNLINEIDVYFDVFYNPEKSKYGTQALPCACLRLMSEQGTFDACKSINKFLIWMESYVDDLGG